MALFERCAGNSIFYEHVPPVNVDCFTFCFFNALTGDTSNWEGFIAPFLRESGHGTLTFNYRGQANSPFSSHLTLDDTCIIEDSSSLLESLQPRNPILVGLSIGGLFAARSWLQSGIGEALVLINTLRANGPRLRWIGDALVRAVEVGGLDLFRDLFMPLLVNENWLQENRPSFLLPDTDYTRLEPENGYYKLLAEAGRTSDWELLYNKLDIPTLVISGLQDHVFLDLDVVTRLLGQLPRSTHIELADAGHLIPLECPEPLALILKNFAGEL